jgi:EAL domain-containing protein (putative c-di-GMP-specific phosphodiesterase class I)
LILSIARELGYAPIAEGVETDGQLDELDRLECRMAQGYLFARPMTLADALAYASASGQRV